MTVYSSGADAQVLSRNANRAFGSTARYQLTSGEARMYLRFNIPLNDIRRNYRVVGATLVITSVEAWAGENILTVRRMTKWEPRKITWGSQPAAAPGSSDVTLTLGSVGKNRSWGFDVLADVLAWVENGGNWGWRLTNNFLGPNRHVYGLTADRRAYRPILELELEPAPAAPEGLAPSFGAVSVPKPRLSWQIDSDFVHDAYELQVSATTDFTSTLYAPGTIVSSDSFHDLAGTSYTVTGTESWWRVRLRRGGYWGPWSDPGLLRYVAPPVVTITSPLANTGDPSPTAQWTAPGQVSRQVIFKGEDGRAIVRSGWDATTDLAWSPPQGLKRPGLGSITVQVRDDVEREPIDGAPDFGSDVVEFAYAPVDGIAAPESLYVQPHSTLPLPVLTWTHPEAPDGWAILRDGVEVAALDTADTVAGAVYSYVDVASPANREHTWQVLPIINGERGEDGPEATTTVTSEGVWLFDPTDLDAWVVLVNSEHRLAYGETSTTYLPPDASASVKVTHGLRGIEGEVAGSLDEDAAPWEVQNDILLDFRSRPAETFRLLLGDINIRTTLRNVSPIVVDYSPYSWDQRVSFEVAQQDEG